VQQCQNEFLEFICLDKCFKLFIHLGLAPHVHIIKNSLLMCILEEQLLAKHNKVTTHAIVGHPKETKLFPTEECFHFALEDSIGFVMQTSTKPSIDPFVNMERWLITGICFGKVWQSKGP
jgi:hypothetical protein